VYLHVSSETFEECETKYLNASHWLTGSVNSLYRCGIQPFYSSNSQYCGCDTVWCSSSYHWL